MLSVPSVPSLLVLLSLFAVDSPVYGRSIRLWPSAVVVGDTIRLSDLAELNGFSSVRQRSLAELALADAPPPGGSRIVHLSMVRAALAADGTNMATVTLRGAVQCEVQRPLAAASDLPRVKGRGGVTAKTPSSDGSAKVDGAAPALATTLRQAVLNYFNRELARYDGRAEVLFDRTSPQVLDLSGPAYTFSVRRRNGPSLGLVQLEVNVSAEGRPVQKVPLVVQLSMVRDVVIARRAISQGVAVRPDDVERAPMTFHRLEKLGVTQIARVVGQRARRLISSGTILQPNMLESVPLVARGQLITLTSVAGAVRVVTTAKALASGLFGQTVTVRSTEDKRVKFDAVVVGPGEVQVGQRAGVARDTVATIRSGE